ncbi:MAG: PP2C family protein-serine/threonine phosphatase [Acidobacteria bacterium]|nr:PP2C family protein-serine/threonine phosphatase [Acidobacteriota bacterium]MCL5289013.1 PP2C family protein-serine/threonine phosphatase [Acidobacteriota bacterium]
MSPTDQIERPINILLALVVLGALAVVAYFDFAVQTISLGFLYVLPLALSAFVFRLRISLGLVLICFVLQDVFGPFEHAGWQHIVRNLLTLIAFLVVVVVVDRLVGQRRRLTELVRMQRDELAQEIELAAQVQQRLLPSAPPVRNGFDIAGRMMAARTVGGDYFDYIELPQGDLGIVIADVSGKGVAAALLMPSVEMALRMDAPSASHTNQVIRNLSNVLFEVTEEDRFVTLFYGKLDVSERLLEYTNAGHLPPLLLRAASPAPQWLEAGGIVTGLVADAEYDCAQVRIEPGDTLVLYTDGLTEATNAAGEQFTRRRLVELVRQKQGLSAQDLISAIHNAVLAFRGSDSLEDDLTLIVVRAAPGASSF